MQKIILALFLLVVGLNFSYSQERNYYIKSGFLSSNAKYDPTFVKGDRPNFDGFSFSVGLKVYSINNLSILTGVEYSQKGIITEFIKTDDYGNEIGTIQYEDKLGYLIVPVNIKYKLTNKFIKPYVSISPTISILVYEDYYQDDWGYRDIPMKNISFGGTFAIGGEIITFDNSAILLEVNYDYNFTNLLKDTDQIDLTINSFGVKVGLLF